MRLVRTTLAFCAIALLLFSHLSNADTVLRVDESATKAVIKETRVELSLAIDNPSAKPVTARVKIELLNSHDRVRGSVEENAEIKPGSNRFDCIFTIDPAWQMPAWSQQERREIIWHRVRYKILTDSSGSDKDKTTEGIISLSEITPDLFDIRVAAQPRIVEGKPYRLIVYAAHPVKLLPAKGVALDAELKYEGERGSLVKVSGVTGEDGYAVLVANLPRNIESGIFDVKVTARRDGQIHVVERESDLENRVNMTISTDRPLYQPGQKIHIRLLARDNFSGHAIANEEVNLKLADPEGTIVFRSNLKTSRFGIASVDWNIPESTRLGKYQIEVDMAGDRYENSGNSRSVNISRYDLPTFAVKVKSDRSYYLAGQNAEVEVRADYLFGKPVPGGRVKVVQESDRNWNYKEQKWDITEGEIYEGTIDKSGRFLAKINLKKHHEGFTKSSYSRYEDISFAAYITDPATNRTEQRRFDLRITVDAIHIYVVEGQNRLSDGFPESFYILTSYADGSPSECEVEMLPDIYSINPTSTSNMRSVRTNQYGVAKVSGKTILRRDDKYYQTKLELRARDRKGLSGDGEHRFWNWSADKAVIKVETSKIIHRAGEPIQARIESNVHDLACIVNLENTQRIISSHVVKLRNGQASLTLPYSEELTGEVAIIAYANDRENKYAEELIAGLRTVLYPHNNELKLDIESARDTYRPGEEASVAFRIRGPDGGAVESALGVVVIDQAVEERARTNQEFGSSFSFCDAYRFYQSSIAGISLTSINSLDRSKPLPEGIDLVAEVLLNRYEWINLNTFRGNDYETAQYSVFSWSFRSQLEPVKNAVDHRYNKSLEYPRDVKSLYTVLAKLNIDFDQIKDPWGNNYRPKFYVNGSQDYFELTSAGADKRFDTPDDHPSVLRMHWPYFLSQGSAITQAVNRYNRRTGQFIRDLATLEQELSREGIHLDKLRDRWGQPYKIEFGVDKDDYTLSFLSGGPNGHFDTSGGRDFDDFNIWTARIDYFDESRKKIEDAITRYFAATSRFPQNMDELKRALKRSALDFENLRDGYGRHCYAVFRTEARYTDRVFQETRTTYGAQPQTQVNVIPVTEQINFILIRSRGADGREGTSDDFNLAAYSRTLADQASRDRIWKPVRSNVIISGMNGAIQGVVTDQSGAVVSSAQVTAIHQESSTVYETKTYASGTYLLKSLPRGIYQVKFEAQGFKSAVYTEVHVISFNVIVLDASLEPGGVSETVTITAGSEETVQKESAEVSSTFESRKVEDIKTGRNIPVSGSQLSTPRLRQYFPETLVWQPEIETDANGQARINFKLADSITTWKLSVVASTINGEMGVAEREIRAFQPFFVEHDPPRFLTEGDEIDLPVIVRNYLDKLQSVNLEMKPESWFAMTGGTARKAEVAAGDAAREIFSFRAVNSVKDGKQRVTAQAIETGDAIEKPVNVRPDGEEMIETASQMFGDRATLEVNVPESAIKNTARTELKIYPNLMAHVIEGIEGIIQRPYGCAEQTISSTYPNLLLLRHYKDRSEDLPVIAQRARRYLRLGYERLLNYESDQGGFSYWGRGEPDTALTAYAIRFLNDASALMQIDEGVVKRARGWLLKQIQKDGRWIAHYWGSAENARVSAMLTASVVRALALDRTSRPDADRELLKRSLDYIATRSEEIDEPYLIATYALAASALGEKEIAARAIEKLRSLARREGDASYWALETNTPFYGWGLAGRIETTALALRAIASNSAQPSKAMASDDLISRGLLFLIRQKDRYGVWYSTQATMNVLDTMTSLLPSQNSQRLSEDSQAEVIVNGRRATTIAIPREDELASMITVDLSGFLAAGANRIEIRRPASSPASAQVVSTYYKPWNRAEADVGAKLRENSLLKLRVDFDKREARVGDEIICHVEAERVGHRGYGMMLAEVGLPPGADVDRQSLEQAMKASGWDIGQYDVLPDRVIVYLWPRAGGSRFSFKFRPRYGIRAQNTASVIYDYYNPEARATVPPVRFNVR